MGKIVYKAVPAPNYDCTHIPVMLNDETMKERQRKLLSKMEEEAFDTLVIYGDLEHGSNFEYLTGFLPRFEEALLVVNKNGHSYMLMGNENLNKVPHSRIVSEAIHAPYFSLPNQPMGNALPFSELLCKAEIEKDKRVGIVGWKNFTSQHEDNSKLFDIPSYIVEGIKQIVADDNKVVNATYLFIGNKGIRCTNNVNEIEHYEYGASLAGDCMMRAMDRLELGVSEISLGQQLNADGQKNSVVTISASGPRFIKANIYPTENTVKLKDTISLTVGYKGGLSSRSGYAVHDEDELGTDYLDAVVKPYYQAVVAWLENIHCGMIGKTMYDLVEKVLPKEEYHWSLCPGHLTADEEWMSSPIYDGSEEVLESGMLFQIDIIPSVKGYGGVSAESTVALADTTLRTRIQKEAPALWQRIVQRRGYIENVLHIKLHEDVLPMTSSVAYLRPFLLNKEKAMAVE